MKISNAQLRAWANRNKVLLSVAAGVVIIAAAVAGNPHASYSIPLPAGKRIAHDHSVKTTPGTLMKVLRVIDGDTIEFVNGERLRYIGIDTPEEFDRRKPVQCFAFAAAARNKALVEGRLIRFFQDVTSHDAYDRWLGFVYLEDGTFVNKKLIEEGFAFAYSFPPDISKSEEMRKAEEGARKQKKGLWSGCQIHKTSTGREQTNAVTE
ncbi:MAG: thermonuclease family protein [bacterium]|nr:thermonuclease family protein [bacterium]